MSTVKLFCPKNLLSDVMAYMIKSDVKYYPVRRTSMLDTKTFNFGYILELEKDHSLVSFLILKFNLNTLSDDYV